MTRSLGALLPDALLAPMAAGDPAEHEGLTFLLLTVREDGWPHLAMISLGELVALDRRELRLALWPSSTATANLERSGRATLAAVVERVSWTVRVAAERDGELETASGGRLAAFRARVEEVGEDVAPYAVLESGVRFSLTDRDATLARWREVRAALRGGER